MTGRRNKINRYALYYAYMSFTYIRGISGLVFTTRYGTGMEPRNYNRLFNESTDVTGLNQYTPHSLRHTAIDLMKRKGFDYEAMQAYVGHRVQGATGEYMTRLLEVAKDELVKVEEVHKEILGIK